MVFDLQLFAEDREAAPAETSAPQSTEANGQESQVQNASETAPEAPKPQMGIVVDPNTGRRTVQEIAEPDASAAPQSAEPEAEKSEATAEGAEQKSPDETKPGIFESTMNQQPAKPYSEQELLLAINMGNTVDESRIPPEYVMQYGQYKAKRDFMAQQAQPEQKPEQPVMKDFYDRIRTVAHKNALAQTGLSAEEYETARFSDEAGQSEKLKAYDVAYKYNEATVIEQIHQYEKLQKQAAEQRQEIYRDIGTVIDGLRQSEPHFNEIDALMAVRYQTLPYKEAHEVAQVVEAFANRTITPEQCKVLQKYYDDSRVEFYTKQNKLTKSPTAKPPVVEKPGTGASIPQSFDFSAMRNMDVRQRREYMANYFNKK